MRRRRSRPIATVLVLALLSAALWWLQMAGQSQPAPVAPGSDLLVTVLDVGQADSIFVRSPAGRTMLVDAGNERRDVEQVVMSYLKKLGVSGLDYLVLTHPDQDHVGGMPTVLDSVKVGVFLDSAQPGETNRAYLRTLQAVQGKGVKAVRARRGVPGPDLGPGTEVQVLGPEDPLLKTGNSPTNNNGVVLRLTYGSVSVLLAADIEREAEERILGHRDNLRSQVLKVAHHGSRYGSSDQFLDAVKPEAALISAGAGNSYGHPHQQTLQRLGNRQVKVYRTDLNGTIEVTIDGRGYRVTAQK